MCYTMKQYENRLRKLDALKAEAARLKSEIDALKDDIINDMESDVIECDAFKASAKLTERRTLDRKEVEKRLSADEMANCMKVTVVLDFRYTLK